MPKLPVQGFIAPSAAVMGDVSIGEQSSIWYGRPAPILTATERILNRRLASYDE